MQSNTGIEVSTAGIECLEWEATESFEKGEHQHANNLLLTLHQTPLSL